MIFPGAKQHHEMKGKLTNNYCQQNTFPQTSHAFKSWHFSHQGKKERLIWSQKVVDAWNGKTFSTMPSDYRFTPGHLLCNDST